MALGMTLMLYASVAKGLTLKVSIWGLIPAFVEVIGAKTDMKSFLPSTPWIGLNPILLSDIFAKASIFSTNFITVRTTVQPAVDIMLLLLLHLVSYPMTQASSITKYL